MASPAPEETPATNSTSPPAPPPSVTNGTVPGPPATNETSPSAGTPTTNGSTPATPAEPPSGGAGLPTGPMTAMVVGVVIGAGIVLVGVAVFVFFYKRRKRKLDSQNLPSHGPKRAHLDDHEKVNLIIQFPTVLQLLVLENHSGAIEAFMSADNTFWSLLFPPANPPSSTSYNRPLLPKLTAPPRVAANSNVPPVAKPSSSSGSANSDKPFAPPSPGIILGNLQSTFTYEELKMATDNFSEANLLGQGGFGYVHKGVLSNGKVVAIKKLKAESGQGEREFQAEIDFINRVHHRHLVSLVGYCMSGDQRLLVYEFVPNKTLEFHLHGQPKIIHRDIKAANILIDDNFEAKVADFGLAKFSLDTDTHVSTRVMGTFGYLAPEYASSGKLTEKSDTFSFGVLLLELITGHRPFDKNDSYLDDSMVDWAKPLLAQALEDGNFDALVDPKLQEYDFSEMTRMVTCAAACVHHSARRRPRMSQIVRALEGNLPLEDLNEGFTPGHSRVFSHGSSEYSSSQYKEDIRKFKLLALQSIDIGSSGFSAVTSNGVQNPSSSSTEGRQTTQEIEPQKEEKDTNVSGQSS
ncbi:hypothetical protein EZV62_003992 [Acer yangbiense]|uniref:non-specific serine/threonine protein kinase n=1 Tax=Acer yangbiense TaxID=1000413 RepID=A0A5C7II94_9ROSI|nr:hypothetical protein EZV62_003992 [Acer yangbiense]